MDTPDSELQSGDSGVHGSPLHSASLTDLDSPSCCLEQADAEEDLFIETVREKASECSHKARIIMFSAIFDLR